MEKLQGHTEILYLALMSREDLKKVVFGTIRSCQFDYVNRGKGAKIKLMGLVYRLMERGEIFRATIDYRGYAPKYGVNDWGAFWSIYDNIDFDLLKDILEYDYEFAKDSSNEYESEAGDIAYEDYLNNNKIWGL